MINARIETILLVEDNPGDARLLLEMLREQGLQWIKLIHATSVNEAEKSLTENAVDVILLDLGLPDANGLEAVRRVRASAPHIPLVVLTGLDDEALASRALQQGAQDYHVKGQIEARGLVRALRYAVERNTLEEALFLEKERGQVTLDCIGDAVACTDISGNLTFLNRVGENLTGWSRGEAAGRPLAEVFRILDGSNRDGMSKPMATALGRDRIAHLAPGSVLVRRDGVEIPIEDSVAPIHDRNGRSTGVVIVVRDVSASRAMAVAMARSATDLAKQNALLSRVNVELAAIVRSSPIAVYSTDPNGIVTMWSPAAERLSGFNDRDAVGVLLPIVPDDAVEDFRSRIRRVSEGEPASNVEFTGRKKDGAMIALSISMGPLTDELGVARGAICLAENVTAAVTERNRIARMQSDFVSTVSHELRTPLTSIAGSLGLIAGGAAGVINARASRLVEIAVSNTQRLIRLVNDILDIEKLQSGQMVFRFEEVNLDEIIEAAISANLHYAATFGIEIRRSGSASNVLIRADKDRVIQAITNLLSNATKFSPPGAFVEISAVRTHYGVRVSVSDRGPGISQEFRARIFERFAQADTTDMRKKGGSGLGLSIVRKIMEHHGGMVSFDSDSQTGATFHLDFHALPGRAAAPPPVQPEIRESRVLVCALNEAIADPICATLLAHGFKCAFVSSEAHAFFEATGGSIKAAIIELPFAQEDIGRFVRMLRDRAGDDQLPIVLLCADNSIRDRFNVARARPVLPWILRLTGVKRPIRTIANMPELSELEKPAILHVENDSAVLEAVRQALHDRFRVVAAPTLEQARQCLARDSFDLIILDLTLSTDLFKHVLLSVAKSDDRATPIVLLTARDAARIPPPARMLLTGDKGELTMLIDGVRSVFAAPARGNLGLKKARHDAQSALR